MPKKYKSEFQKMYEKIERFDPKTGTYAEDPEAKAEKDERAKIPGFKGFIVRNWGYLTALLICLVIVLLFAIYGRNQFPELGMLEAFGAFIGTIWIFILAAVIIIVSVWYYLKYGRHDDGKNFRW